MFGHEDIVAGRNYTTSVTCQTLSGSLYSISAQEFVSKFDEETWKIIEAKAE